mgnify:FL=1
MDYEQGTLFIHQGYGLRDTFNKIRVKYRYGDVTVSKIVEDIATKLVAIDLILSETRVVFPEGGLSIDRKIEILRKDIDDKLSSLIEWTPLNIGSV